MKRCLGLISFIAGSLLFCSIAAAADDCSADSIKQFVDKAVAIIQEKGEAGYAELGALRFCEGKGYVYVQFMDGVMAYHPVLPHLVGKNVASVKDAGGRLFGVELLEGVMKNNEHWITYMWPKPNENTPSKKCGYGKKAVMDGKDVVVGSGLYDIPDGQCGGK